MGLFDRFKDAWNVFADRSVNTRDPEYTTMIGTSSSRPPRTLSPAYDDRTIMRSVINRIAIDVSNMRFYHAYVDERGNYMSRINSELDNCLNFSANIDQTPRAFIQDAVESLLQEGCIAIVPVETRGDPNLGTAFDVLQLRVGKVVDWYPKRVKIELYNENTGRRELVVTEKERTAIIQNPLYSVMNEPNSTLRRLITKINTLDTIDDQSRTGQLDIIIQLPYSVKNTIKQKYADDRIASIETQLENSRHGVAYIDGTEKVVQLNRPAANNLLEQIKDLTAQLYGQLGISEAVFNGTADESQMLNYYNRSIDPIADAITQELARSFVTRTEKGYGKSIVCVRNIFDLVPAGTMAEIADLLTRNEILSSNEMRAGFGFQPVNTPEANALKNKNLRPTDTNTESPANTKRRGVTLEDIKRRYL